MLLHGYVGDELSGWSHQALARAAGKRSGQIRKSLDLLASLKLDDREEAWR